MFYTIKRTIHTQRGNIIDVYSFDDLAQAYRALDGMNAQSVKFNQNAEIVLRSQETPKSEPIVIDTLPTCEMPENAVECATNADIAAQDRIQRQRGYIHCFIRKSNTRQIIYTSVEVAQLSIFVRKFESVA